jgi:predicted enzyme related to lactoylglutathione lyase
MPEARQHIHAVTYLVHDYDQAIGWFRGKLGFTVVADEPLGEGKRWVLAKAAGGRVAYFLHCSDFPKTHTKMRSEGVNFLEQPRHESYGTVAVFEDLYGNKWDLIEPAR